MAECPDGSDEFNCETVPRIAQYQVRFTLANSIQIQGYIYSQNPNKQFLAAIAALKVAKSVGCSVGLSVPNNELR